MYPSCNLLLFGGICGKYQEIHKESKTLGETLTLDGYSGYLRILDELLDIYQLNNRRIQVVTPDTSYLLKPKK
jgi:hypothetical protein